MTHVIKNRLKKAIPCIILVTYNRGSKRGQVRVITFNILICLTLEHFNNNPEEEGLLLQLDF